MTAQIADVFELDERDFSVVGINGHGWFDPECYRLHPAGGHCTACWRGYVGAYTLKQEQLVLDELQIDLTPALAGARTVRAPKLNGVKPWKPRGLYYYRQLVPELRDEFGISVPELETRLRQIPGIDLEDPHTWKDMYSFCEYVYEGLGLEIQFTGSVLLARHFIKELYVHMGFHPAWKYKQVHELRFKAGRLFARADVSRKIAVLRHIMRRFPLEPGGGTDLATLARWIRSTGSLDYEL